MPARKHKYLSSLKIGEPLSREGGKNPSPVFTATKVNRTSHKEWIFKIYSNGRRSLLPPFLGAEGLAQLEAAVSEFMRFLLATPTNINRACKIRAVIDDEERCIGALIQKIPFQYGKALLQQSD